VLHITHVLFTYKADAESSEGEDNSKENMDVSESSQKKVCTVFSK